MKPKAEGETRSDRVQQLTAARVGVSALGAALLIGGAAQAQEAEPAGGPNKAKQTALGNEIYQDEDVIVVGSRLPRETNDPGPAPVTIFSEERIKELGVTNVADVLNYLPQQTIAVNEQNTFGAARSVRLRGLGAGTTLVLINGRRTVTSALQGQANFFDLNSVPLTAVERIEVLSDSASAVYGADAVGGVLNIVLKKNISAPVVDLYYGTAEGGADEKRASISAGLNTERFRGSVVLDGFDRDMLSGSERDLFSNRDFTRFGGQDMRVPFANPGNIFMSGPGNLPGLNAPFAAVPAGSTGVGLTPASFAGTQGTLNRTSSGIFASAIPESQRLSAVSSAEFDITEKLQVFGEVLYADRDDTRALFPSLLGPAGPGLPGTPVPATNAFNPFGVTVLTNYLFTGIGSQLDDSNAETIRATLGFTGDIGGWTWEVTGLRIDDSGDQQLNNVVDPVKVMAALASSDPNTALNVFQDGPGGSPALLASLRAAPVKNTFESNANQVAAFVRGSLVDLPAGPLQLVVGAEAREEEMTSNVPNVGRLDADRDTKAGYAELGIPLISSDMDVAAVNRLKLTLAGRYDDYSDFGGTFNPQYGLQWNPIEPLLLRVSYGTSYRAPSLFELNRTVMPLMFAIPDPRRGNALSPFTFISGGNPNLDAEEADSLTAGFLLTPADSSLRLGASFWSVEQDQRVLILAPNAIVAAENLFPGRVVRAAPTPADIAAGQPGALVSIDGTSVNFGRLEAEGVDFEASDAFETSFGKFAPSVTATYFTKYDVADVPNGPVVDRIGVATPLANTIPEWRATAGLAWSLRGFAVSTTARFTPSYDDVNTAGIRTGLTVDSQTLIDLAVSLNTDELSAGGSAWAKGFVLRLGVTNLTDEDPPYSSVSGGGFDTSMADVRQRFVYFGLSKKF